MLDRPHSPHRPLPGPLALTRWDAVGPLGPLVSRVHARKARRPLCAFLICDKTLWTMWTIWTKQATARVADRPIVVQSDFKWTARGAAPAQNAGPVQGCVTRAKRPQICPSDRAAGMVKDGRACGLWFGVA